MIPLLTNHANSIVNLSKDGTSNILRNVKDGINNLDAINKKQLDEVVAVTTDTLSNIGVGGIGVFKQKVGVIHELKNINSASNKVSVVNDAANDEIDIDIVEGNIVHDNLSGAGTNTHTQIDTHLASAANPHSVSASQVSLGNVLNVAQVENGLGTPKIISDVIASQPAAGNAGVLFISTDEKSIYRDTGSIWEDLTGLRNVVEDTSPQLGGNLDVNGFDIVSASNGNIEIKPNGTGQVIFQAGTDATIFFQILDADGGTPIFSVDSVDERIGIKIAAPTETLHIGSGNIKINSAGLLILEETTQTDSRTLGLTNQSTINNLPLLSIYPETTETNVGSALQIIPKGTGFNSAIKSQLTVYATDYIADSVNWEAMVIRAGGSFYSLDTIKGGTGTIRPIVLQLDGLAKLNIATNGNVLIGNNANETMLDIDSNSNTKALRLRGTNAANEIADFYVDNIGSLVINTSVVAPQDLKIQCGTNKTLELQEIVFDDIAIGSTALEKGSNAPDLVNFLSSGGLKILAFDGSATEESLHGIFEMSHKYKEGTEIIPHLHWVPTTANSGNVVWQFEYSWINVDGTYGASTTITVTDASDSTAWKHLNPTFAAISASGKVIDSVMKFRIFRDPAHGSDTYADDAGLLDIGLHFQANTIGSRQILIK